MPKVGELERIDAETRGEITHVTSEVTAMCPFGGVQDHYEIEVRYVPASWQVELKSLKLYFESFRGEEFTHEGITERIFQDLSSLLEPEEITITCRPNIRGGIETEVVRKDV